MSNHNCTTCRCIVDSPTLKRCRECINKGALSYNDVRSDYKGWLILEIMEARSWRTSTPMRKEGESDAREGV